MVFVKYLPTLQTEQVKRYSALAHLGIKNMFARARQMASKNLHTFAFGKASPIYAFGSGSIFRHPCKHRRHTLQLRSNPFRYAPLGTHSRRAVLFSSAKRSLSRHPRLLFAPLNPNKVFATLTKFL